ncbi:hypothetical protein [Serratia ureilytica]|uniref:hypothetical protein n=1 Tax=Serratia ureilytica TaxID=300181 RepID=UPI002361C26F|nr:hypothetical protein [Serratia ureilytica]
MLTIVLKDETVSTCGRAHGGALAQHEADRLSPSKVIIFSSYTFGADWRYLHAQRRKSLAIVLKNEGQRKRRRL